MTPARPTAPLPARATTPETAASIERTLRAARQHLGLDVAFVGELAGDHRRIRFLDVAPGRRAPVVERWEPAEETLCARLADGALPGFLHDASRHPVAARLAATHDMSIRTHLGVPVRLGDGRIYGTLCCYSTAVHPGLDPRSVEVLSVVAAVVAEELEADAQRVAHDHAEGVRAVLRGDQPLEVAFQPIFDLRSRRPVCVEALARFPSLGCPPDVAFERARAAGIATDLEILAVERAIATLGRIPAGCRLGVNVGPTTLVSEELHRVIRRVPADRLVVELTEHHAVADYEEVSGASRQLRRHGTPLWIDDVGAGFAGLKHILETEPDGIKIDGALVAGVQGNPAKQAMIAALVAFARATEIAVIAEGVEVVEELDVVTELGITLGQGHHLCRPGPLDAVLAGVGP